MGAERYNIIICEKPSVSREYCKALKVQQKGSTEGYIEGKSGVDGKNYRITWSIGHLVTMSYPKAYNASLEKWSLEALPFLPEKYMYETIPATRKQYNVVKQLYHASDIDTIYYAGDSGREGIYIQMLIRMLAGHTAGVTEKVVWIDSQTEDEILRGIREAKPVSAYQKLTDAAYMRGIEDYSVGINFSRALSCKFGYQMKKELSLQKYKPVSVGRVMTCVLGMIVKREREIRSFQETIFYRPGALCADFTAKWKAVEGTPHYGQPGIYNNEGFLKYGEADAFKAQLEQNPDLTVTKADLKTEKKQPPMLYNLAEIQNDCTKLFKISPDETLAAIQTLYERKLVTYPRTDARVLSTAVAKEILNNLRGLSNMEYKSETVKHIITSKAYAGLETTRYCNDSKITDHYAIIPTGQGDPESLKGIHKEVYELIVRRFLSIFYPPAEFKKIELELKHACNEYFYASEKVLKVRGYLEILDEGEVKEDTILMQIKAGQVIHAAYQITEGKTTPPKRYTSGSMILAMENAGNLIEDEELRNQIKSCGIGTSATRAAILSKLVENGHIVLEKKTQVLKPLVLGEKIYDIVEVTIPALLSPQMTASWEKGLSQIEEGTVTKEIYQQKLNAYVAKEVEAIKGMEAAEPEEFVSETVCRCPFCGKNVITTPFGYKCEDYKKGTGCSFYVAQIAGRSISKEELTMLVNEGATDTLDGFTGKSGKAFRAKLVLNNAERKINFEFEEKPVQETDYACPKCRQHMQKDEWSLTCSCGVKIPHTIAKKQLPDDQIRKLLTGKTDLIHGFTSKAGKKFNAYVVFDGEKTAFEFEQKAGGEKNVTQIACPKCRKNLARGKWNMTCECGFTISHTIAKKQLTDKQMASLLSGKTELIKGFTNKAGKKFDAYVVFDGEKTSFEFPV